MKRIICWLRGHAEMTLARYEIGCSSNCTRCGMCRCQIEQYLP